jgi:hypothetical protein
VRFILHSFDQQSNKRQTFGVGHNSESGDSGRTEKKLIIHTSIPGPIEIADEVLYANAHASMSHVSTDFISVFGDCIRMMRFVAPPTGFAPICHRTLILFFFRQVLFTKDAQPFIISASGTLGWDQVCHFLLMASHNTKLYIILGFCQSNRTRRKRPRFAHRLLW